MAKELPKRSEVKVENTWNLADMFKSDEEWNDSLNTIEEKAKELIELEGKVGNSSASLLKALDVRENEESKYRYVNER